MESLRTVHTATRRGFWVTLWRDAAGTIHMDAGPNRIRDRAIKCLYRETPRYVAPDEDLGTLVERVADRVAGALAGW